MPDNSEKPNRFRDGYQAKSYELSGKIMLSAIVILFAVVIFMVCLHLYARWYLLRARRRNLHRPSGHSRRRRRSHLVFYVDTNNPSTTVTVPHHGLDASLLNSLPVFLYSSKTHPESLECAVCLSEFEDNEKGRLLPKCNHSFHVECIDMWFHSHSTCPLCRSPVEPGPVESATIEIVVETEAGSSSGLCSTCQHEEEHVGTSSFEARRKPLVGVSIEVPRRNESFGRSDDESGTGSPASQMFKSPGSRILSLKRILSRGLSSPSGTASPASCGSGNIESTDIENQQVQAHTPR